MALLVLLFLIRLSLLYKALVEHLKFLQISLIFIPESIESKISFNIFI